MNRDQKLLEEAYNQVRLFESPEVVGDIYDRTKYDFEFFLGDAHGTLIKEYIPTIETHAHFLRKLKQVDAIDEDYNIVHKNVLEAADNILGKPICVDFNYSGIILPKQQDVDATYISFWTEEAYNSNDGKLAQMLLSYAKKNFKGPFKFEITEMSRFGETSSKIRKASD
jgi:hypothetical protein